MDFYPLKGLKLSIEIAVIYALITKLAKDEQIGGSHEHPVEIQQILKEFEPVNDDLLKG